MALETTEDFARAEYNEAMKDLDKYNFCPYCTTRLVFHSIPSYDDTDVTEEFLECKECNKDLDISDWNETTQLEIDQTIDRDIDERHRTSSSKRT